MLFLEKLVAREKNIRPSCAKVSFYFAGVKDVSLNDINKALDNLENGEKGRLLIDMSGEQE